jgi:hypothetical protein
MATSHSSGLHVDDFKLVSAGAEEKTESADRGHDLFQDERHLGSLVGSMEQRDSWKQNW